MKKAIIYTKNYCMYCSSAKRLLQKLNIQYTEIDVTYDRELEEEMFKLSGRDTVPQIFLHIGGSDDLHEFYENGDLDPLLK
ncbi:MAG: glutaredoxin domain-containing protein [Candidatus Gracilibacteria bacterium]